MSDARCPDCSSLFTLAEPLVEGDALICMSCAACLVVGAERDIKRAEQTGTLTQHQSSVLSAAVALIRGAGGGVRRARA